MDNQRKRPEQTKFAEDASFYSLIGLIITLIITIIIK